MKSWGKHLIIDAHKCINISCPTAILRFSSHLVSSIDMIPYGDPILKHFGEGSKAGFTLVQLIETSNITAHFCDESRDIYLDVFSCKDYDPKKVVEIVETYFYPSSIRLSVIDRQAGVDNKIPLI